MQPFLFRASLTRRFSSFSISYPYRLPKTKNARTTVTGANKNPSPSTDCPLKKKFGEFYKRFYSTVSGVEVLGRDGEDQGSAQGGGRGRKKTYAEKRAERRRREQELNQIPDEGLHDIKTNPGFTAFPNTYGEQNYQEESYINPPLPPPRKRVLDPNKRFITKEKLLLLEKSIIELTSRLLEHDRLSRELRSRIKHRQIERSRIRCYSRTVESRMRAESLRKTLEEEVELLKKTLSYITVQFYDPPDPAPETQTDYSEDFKGPSIGLLSAYFPPFPNYTSNKKVTVLNRAIRLLLFTRPPPPALIPRICYNLLISPSPPNLETYNTLIQGLTQVRHSSLAHMVFRNMVEAGIKPDEGTVARMVNLCVKSADRVGFERIAKITAHRNMAKWWGFGINRTRKTRQQKARSKMVLESFIHGAARFGDVQQVHVWLHAMKRECPEFPEPSIYLLTSLLRLWTEMKDWDNGLRAWESLMRLDMEWHCGQVGYSADIRAFHQMLKLCQVCKQKKAHKDILDLAIQRGYNEQEVLVSISKTKGLWVRRENKTPHIRGQRRNDEGGGVEILDSLEKAWDTPAPSEEFERPIGVNSSISPQRTQHHRNNQLVPDTAKSRVWLNVISRRMNDTRPASVSGVEVRQTLAEQRRQQKHTWGAEEKNEEGEDSEGLNTGVKEGMAAKEERVAKKRDLEVQAKVATEKGGNMKGKGGSKRGKRGRGNSKKGGESVKGRDVKEGKAKAKRGKRGLKQEGEVKEGKTRAKQGKAVAKFEEGNMGGNGRKKESQGRKTVVKEVIVTKKVRAKGDPKSKKGKERNKPN